ncbi:MAG TPA: M20/M25/M40 family metallo-hydrolase [Bacteroidales bacterium]|nr:M20/M25/M40 family metallo-hydrolase [Bacteroidales bacterium]
MKRSRLLLSVIVFSLLPVFLAAQKENLDLAMVYKIKQAGSRGNSLEEMAYGLTDFAGPRLTGSTGGNRGNEWAKKKMEEIGLVNVRIEEARDNTRGGWDNLKTYAAMTEPYYASFACNPVAWTGSTKGLVKGEVVLINAQSVADLEKYKGKLAGKIVLMPSTATYEMSFTPFATRYTDEQLKEISMAAAGGGGARRPQGDMAQMAAQREIQTRLQELLRNEGVAVVINNSGTFNVPRSNGANYRWGDPEPVPQLNIPIEAYGRMVRLINHNVPVVMEVEIQNKFFESPKIYNVIGEIPGTDKVLKDEVVLLGGHIDSWHGGTGAADNASGCIVMLEAVRILKSLNAAPKRTIRVALWGGEEQGLNGSRGYVEKYLMDAQTRAKKPGWDKFAGYFNMDNGSGKYRGIYLQSNEMLRPVFEEWLKPFADMGCSTVTIRNTGGTDHQSFDAAGLPAFQFIQDPLEYNRGYHTVMDTYERLVMSDLRHNAIVTAAFAWFAAQRDTKLVGKPDMPQMQGAGQRFGGF